MTNWKTHKLGEIASVQTGPFGSQLHAKDYKEVGTPIITVEHLGENFIVHSNLPLVSDSDKERLKKYTLIEGDIVFSRVGSVDRRAYVSDKENGWLFSGRCLRVRIVDKAIDSKYLSYYFGLESFKEYIRQIAVGATMPSLNTGILNEIEFTAPDFPTQRRIAEILSALDDKIELNRRMNQTLEQMAQTLFRQYFADGIDEENLPEGWREGKLKDVLGLVYGKSLKQGDRKGGEYPVVGSSGIVGYHNTFIAEGKGIVVGRKGNAGAVIWLDHKFYPIDTTYYVVDQLQVDDLYFHYFLLKSLPLAGMNSDSAVPGLNRNDAYNIDILIPSRESIIDFNNKVRPLFDQKYTKVNEITTLTQLRDTLLPKLMSGEIDVMQMKTDEQHEPILS